METKTKNEEFAFFWGGTMSQWAKSKFVIDGIEFNTCEQYMMYKKAMLFDDQVTADKILKADHPRVQKKLGREVTPYDDAKWVAICKEVVYDANVAKFTQNPEMREELMFTAGKTLVEASPHDKRWGIGLAADSPLAKDRSTWKGDNWLGEAIERVREDMISGKIK
jgi:ribA/ribD-fused uncharacterized protein